MLTSALARCTLRRLGRALTRSPLLAGGAALVACATPVLLWRAGAHAGEAVAPFLVDRQTALVLLLPLLLAAALGGATLTLVLPDERRLDAQLRAAPVPRSRLAFALTVAPTTAAAAGASVLLLVAALPLAAALPGGEGGAAALVAGAAAACAMGAAVAEAALAAARRSWHGAAALPLLLLVPAVASDALDSLAGALLDPGAVAPAAGKGLALWTAASAAWLALVVRRPPPRPLRPPLLVLPLPRGAARAWHVAALARYGRRRELVHAAAAGVACGGLGAAGLTAAGAGATSALVLGATTGLLGACAFPLAHHGLDLRGRWLWLVTRGRGRAAAAGAAAAAAALLALAAVAAVAVPAALLGSADVGALGAVTVASAGAVALALLAGVVVPWRQGGLGEQLASFGAFAGLALCASFGVAAAAEPALRIVPEPVFAVAVVALPALTAVWLGGRSFGSLP